MLALNDDKSSKIRHSFFAMSSIYGKMSAAFNDDEVIEDFGSDDVMINEKNNEVEK